jgi:hypothetical protein
MLSIRKFVGCARLVAGVGAVLMLAVSPETAAARSMEGVPDTTPSVSATTNVTQITLSPACRAALQTLKTAIVNDRQEDADERANPDPAGDAAEDAAEAAQMKALFASVRAACADEIDAIKQKIAASRTATRSAACTAALEAWKSAVQALWAQHTRPTDAQLANLRALGQAAKTACGWTWPSRYAWHR